MKPPYRELVTINGKNVVLAHNEPPVVNAGVLENADIFRMINIFAEQFSPSNIDKADGTLNALQQAFQQHHALQCGFCTPGILMSFTDYLARNPHPTEDEIREVLSGHLCRCTGYAGIVAAVLAASGGEPNPESRSHT